MHIDHDDQIGLYKFRTNCLIALYQASEKPRDFTVLGMTCFAAPPIPLVWSEPYCLHKKSKELNS